MTAPRIASLLPRPDSIRAPQMMGEPLKLRPTDCDVAPGVGLGLTTALRDPPSLRGEWLVRCRHRCALANEGDGGGASRPWLSVCALPFDGPRVTRYRFDAVTPEVHKGICPWCGVRRPSLSRPCPPCQGHPKPRRSLLTDLAPKESVGSWPMAITIPDAIGGMPACR